MLNTILYFFLHFILGYQREPLHVIKQLMCSFHRTEIYGSRDHVRMRARGCAWRRFPHMLTCCGHGCLYKHHQTKIWLIIDSFSYCTNRTFSLSDFLGTKILFKFSYIAILFVKRTVILMDGLANFCFFSFNSRAFNASFNLERAHRCTDSW